MPSPASSTANEMAVATAIRSMQVRGAPLIGATAAFGVAIALRADRSDAQLDAALKTLAATRPTAVNLHWALDRMDAALRPLPESARGDAAWAEAEAIRAADADMCAAIGEHGVRSGDERAKLPRHRCRRRTRRTSVPSLRGRMGSE